MQAYIALLITYTDYTYNDDGSILEQKDQSIFIETTDETTISKRNEITTHPIVNGDLAADHMIKQPKELSFNGIFSLNGSEGVLINGVKPSLKTFEETFDRISNNGFLCAIAKVVQKSNESRFSQYQNMVLTSSTIKERINSLEFDFSFTEVLTVEVNAEPIDVDLLDENLPAITNAKNLSFGDTFMDWNQVDAYVAKILLESDLCTPEFREMAIDMAKLLGGTILVGALGAEFIYGGLTAISAAGGLAAAGGSTAAAGGPIGWVIGGAMLVLAAVVVLISGIANAIKNYQAKKKYKIDQFKKYLDDKKNKAEVERFANFVGQICIQLRQLENAYFVYQIMSNEAQICTLLIGNEYYDFDFHKLSFEYDAELSLNKVVKSTSGWWNVKITMPQYEDKFVYEANVIPSAKESFDQCHSSNCLFRAQGTGSYVYLMYLKNENYEADDLRNYYVMVANIAPEKLNDAINDIIDNAIYL